MDNIREYCHSDYDQIKVWFWDRDMFIPFSDDLPETGLIIDNVAAGFLIWTDTSMAILDFFVTNPKASLIQRGKAINAITDGLMKKAKKLGFHRVKCDSQISTIQRKASSLGFLDLGAHQVFIKEI